MSESAELLTTVNYIKNKVDALEKIEMLNLRSNKELRDEYISLLRGDIMLQKVYRAIDGIKAQKDIAESVGTSEKTVSLKVKELSEYGLIEIKSVSKNGKRIYKHSVAEQAFKLTRML